MDLEKLQRLFQQALISDCVPFALHNNIVGGTLSPNARLNIYRNSQQAILITALKQTYPVCLALVGEDCFHGLAVRFMAQETQNSPNIQIYGARFANHMELFSKASPVPYLADVARVEWAILQASIGEDASAIDFVQLAQVPLSQQGDLCFHLPQNATLLMSNYPVDTIWQAHQPHSFDDVDTHLQPAGVRLIIWRRQLEVLCERLTQAQWFVLHRMQKGNNFNDICQQAMLQPEKYSIDEILPTMMTRGWIAQFTI